jgi:YVTN family beta-propeller protein
MIGGQSAGENMRISLKCILMVALSLCTSAHAASKKTYLYLANSETYNVSIVDTSSNKIVKTLSLDGLSPISIAMDPKGAYAYIGATNDLGSYYLFTIDTATKSIVAKLAGDAPAYALAIAPTGKTAYIADGGAWAVDIKTGKQTNIEQQLGAGSLALSPDGKLLYVVNTTPPEVVAFSASNYQSVATIILENLGTSLPSSIAISPDGSTAYVSYSAVIDPNQQPSGVQVINLSTDTVVNSIDIPYGPTGLMVTPNGQWLYVAEGGYYGVAVIDTSTQTVTNLIDTGTVPNTGISFTPDGAFAYVANGGTAVPVIDTSTQTWVGQVADTGFYPFNIAITGTVIP